MTGITIRPYQPDDENAVIRLWEKCDLTRPWNNPKRDIERKLKVDPELFLVALYEGKIVGSVMGGYEGHRGWVNYLGVDPTCRRKGIGRKIMEAVEKKLVDKGCPKINLQIREDSSGAVGFYEAIGFKAEPILSMGKRLVEDSSPP